MTIDPIWIQVGAWLIVGLVGIVVATFWWGFRAVIQLLGSIQTDLRELGGRIIKVESWTENHEKQDDARHAEMREEISGLWKRG